MKYAKAGFTHLNMELFSRVVRTQVDDVVFMEEKL